MEEPYNCNDTIVQDKIRRLIQDATEIPYDPNDLKDYFNKVFERLILNPENIRNVECFRMSEFYKHFARYILHMNHTSTHNNQTPVTADDIPENSLLTIKIPGYPGEYHYITAVISPDKDLVDIYQSYGYSQPLYDVLNIPMDAFVELMEDCRILDQQTRQDRINNRILNLRRFQRIYRVLSRINIERKVIELNHSYNYDYEMDGDEDDEDEPFENSILPTLMDVDLPGRFNPDNMNPMYADYIDAGFSNERGIHLLNKAYDDYLNTQNSFILEIWQPHSVARGRKKPRRNHKKTHKKQKSKTSKKSVRKTKRNRGNSRRKI